MSDEKSPSQGQNDAIKVALIGAAATVMVAIISGIFTTLQREGQAQQAAATNAAIVAVALQSAEDDRVTSDGGRRTTARLVDSPSAALLAPIVITDTGIAFASTISPDGVALNPSTTFPAKTRSLYVVFRPGRTPPGLQVSHPAPTIEHYYAYLEAAGSRVPSSVGWRWYYKDELVNEYETELGENYLWLMVYSQGENGLFEGILGEAGLYDVYITLAGNPSLHSQLLIEP
jgi:hypothetical protein